MKKILVRLPNWLGDAAMATPALTNLVRHDPSADVVLVGPPPLTEMFTGDPRFAAVAVDQTRKARWRFAALWSFGRQLRQRYGQFEVAFALPNSVSARLFLRATGARHRVGIAHGLRDWWLTHPIPAVPGEHMVEFYNRLIMGYLGTLDAPGPMSLHVGQPRRYPRPTAGLNPGAAYGSAKRWDPANFGALGAALAPDFDLVILGGPTDRGMAADVERELQRRGITNYLDLAGRTSIRELIEAIAGLDLLLANDSGPLHLATALGVPTVAIFGPTDPQVSRPWLHPNASVVRHRVPCSPCMRRVCPFEHHACMRELSVDEVLRGVKALGLKRRSAVA